MRSDRVSSCFLGSVCEKIGSGATPRGGKNAYQDSGVALIRSQNVLDLKFSGAGLARISDEAAEKLSSVSVRDGDVLLNITGDSVARCCVAPQRIGAARVNQHVAILRPDPSLVDSSFLAYWLIDQKQRLLAMASGGATRPALTKAMIERMEINLPSIRDQRALAKMLGALEAKIENNHKLARTLEEIAATLFRARFVDFVDHDDLVDSEIGPIPRDWRVVPVGEQLQVRGGNTPSTKNPDFWEGGDIAWATPRDLSGLNSPILRSTARKITLAGLGKISSGLLPRGTVLLSSRAPVGYTALADTELAVNQGFIAIPPSDSIPSAYILFWLRENMQLIEANAGGTTFAEISKKAFRPLPMAVPPPEELDTFGSMAEPLLARIAAADRESDTLTEIRDTLLPKLISGEIRVPEAEEVVEEAV